MKTQLNAVMSKQGSFTGVAKVEDNRQKQLSVYPNPATEFLVLDFISNTPKAYFEVYDMMGKVVFTGRLEATMQNKISLQALGNGLHIIKVTDNTGTYTTKFLKFGN